jgi:tetratricopeptide (TPR) repeat protein
MLKAGNFKRLVNSVLEFLYSFGNIRGSVLLDSVLAITAADQVIKALRFSQAHLKSRESILDSMDERYLCVRYLVGQDLHLLARFRESVERLEPFMKELPESTHYTVFLQTVACLGGSYNRLKEYHTSLDLCKKTMERFEKCVKHEVLEILAIYNVMGEALSGLKRPQEGLIWSTKAVLGAQKLYGMAHSRTSQAMGYLARNYADLNDLQKACDWQEKCVNSMKNSLGANHPKTIYEEERLVDYVAQRRTNLLSRKKVIGRRKAHLDKLSEQFGEKDWRTLDCQARLAQDYFVCASFKKAMLMQEKWVEIMIQEFGADDERTVEGVAQLARTKRWIKTRNAVYWWLPKWLLT